ncbi:phage terminase large subunit family protein [Escherichia coli]|nr:phage terminase large subunit family protein [Escherichia coli]
MNISNSQVNRLRHFVRAGLRSLFRPEPQTAVEWADANYYLPKESAYQEGRWETLPFQRAIMNAMGSDYIREVNVVKSARVGYSKMLLGVYAYFIEHKQRNTLIWLPTDGDAENFMKTHVEPTIRDIPSLLALAPWYGKKHRDNTLTMKRFTNGRGFWCLGGKAAKNYREKSVDVAGYDELAAFDDDIEQEGSPTFLGDKRIEGSVSRRLVTQTARTGSIGVMMAHSNYGAALEKQGVEITLIYSGSHKVDGNPYSHLPDDVRETLQSRMDATRQMFAQKVSAYTGLSVQAVLDTEAAVYSGHRQLIRRVSDVPENRII